MKHPFKTFATGGYKGKAKLRASWGVQVDACVFKCGRKCASNRDTPPSLRSPKSSSKREKYRGVPVGTVLRVSLLLNQPARIYE